MLLLQSKGTFFPHLEKGFKVRLIYKSVCVIVFELFHYCRQTSTPKHLSSTYILGTFSKLTRLICIICSEVISTCLLPRLDNLLPLCLGFFAVLVSGFCFKCTPQGDRQMIDKRGVFLTTRFGAQQNCLLTSAQVWKSQLHLSVKLTNCPLYFSLRKLTNL